MRRTKPRAFRRDGAISIRVSQQDKMELRRLAGIKRRDTSSLAYEFIMDGVAAMNAHMNAQTPAQQQRITQ